MLAEHARALKGGESGTLGVAATPQTIAILLAPFLPGHRKRHPGVEVRLIEGSASQQFKRLERGEVQLVVMPAGGGPFARRLLYAVHALAVLLKSHPLSRRAVVEVDELAAEPLLLLQREYASRSWFDAACELAQTKPRILMEATTAHTLIELAAVGYGVAVVSSTTMIRNPQLRAIPIVRHKVSVGQWSTVCWDPQRDCCCRMPSGSQTNSWRTRGARLRSRIYSTRPPFAQAKPAGRLTGRRRASRRRTADPAGWCRR